MYTFNDTQRLLMQMNNTLHIVADDWDALQTGRNYFLYDLDEDNDYISRSLSHQPIFLDLRTDQAPFIDSLQCNGAPHTVRIFFGILDYLL